MRFRVKMQALLDAWSYLSKVVVMRTATSSDGVEVTAEGDTLILVHSDRETGVRVRIPQVEILEEGRAFFQLKSLIDSTKEFKKESFIEISTKESAQVEDKLTVYSKLEGGASGAMNGSVHSIINLFDYVDDEELQTLVVPQRVLKRGLTNTFFALSSGVKPQNLALYAVFVEIEPESIKFLATSLNHFATYTFTNQNTNGISTKLKIPQRSAGILEGMLKDIHDSDATISFNEGLLRIDTDDFSFVTRQKDEEYPDFQNMRIPTDTAREIIISRSSLYEGASYANNYVGQKGLAGIITIKDNRCYLAVEDSNGGCSARYNMECTAMFEGEYTVGCRFDIITTACSRIESQDINILFPAIPGQPAYFYPTQNSEENVLFEQILATSAIPNKVKAIPEEDDVHASESER